MRADHRAWTGTRFLRTDGARHCPHGLLGYRRDGPRSGSYPLPCLLSSSRRRATDGRDHLGGPQVVRHGWSRGWTASGLVRAVDLPGAPNPRRAPVHRRDSGPPLRRQPGTWPPSHRWSCRAGELLALRPCGARRCHRRYRQLGGSSRDGLSGVRSGRRRVVLHRIEPRGAHPVYLPGEEALHRRQDGCRAHLEGDPP